MSTKPPARDPYLVKSVVHSSQLLSAFRSSGEALQLREIAARLMQFNSAYVQAERLRQKRLEEHSGAVSKHQP